MNIFLYTMLFLIGALVGNFWKIATYRIPRNIKLNKKGVSYIEPNGKSNITSKLFYLLLGGVVFIICGKVLKIDINNIQPLQIITYIFTILYISLLIIIAGIDQKFIKMEKSVITGGIILSILYMIYMYAIETVSLNTSIIYLGIYIILIAIDTFIVKKYAENSYTTGILMLFNIMLIFTGIDVFTYTVILTTLEILVSLLISKIKQKNNGNKKIKLSNIPVGYFLCVSNLLAIVDISAMTTYIR